MGKNLHRIQNPNCRFDTVTSRPDASLGLLPPTMKPLIFLAILTTIIRAEPVAERPKVVAYVPNWNDLATFAPGIDYAKVTHLNVAFENAVNDSGDMSWNPDNAVLVKLAKARGVKVLLSIGGGSASGDKALLARYGALLDKGHRAAFAAKLARFVRQHDFDGLDVDLEGPSITADYGPFIAILRRECDSRKLMLTAALSRGYGGDRVPDATLREFDFINLMAYDATGPWNPKAAGQHASLEMAEQTVAYWLKRGLPKEKAVLGVPFYGYGFGPAFKARDYPFGDIVRQYPGAEQTDQTGDTIYYNGKPTIRAKCLIVRNQSLAGIMIWSLDSDATGEHSLLKVIAESLGNGNPHLP